MAIKCPSCGYENKGEAPLCNLCGALLSPKAAPIPAASAAAAQSATTARPESPAAPLPPLETHAPGDAPRPSPRDSAGAGRRIPSWPNRSVLCFLFTPFLALLLLPIFMNQDPNENDYVRAAQHDKLMLLVITALGNLGATVPLAARLRAAPIFAIVTCAVLGVVGLCIEPGMASGLFWVSAGGAGMAWYGRSMFTRPWVPTRVVGWTVRGYVRLFRPGRFTALRVIGGIVLFLGGIAAILLLGPTLARETGVARPWAKLLAIPCFVGGALAASGFTLSEAV